LSFFCKRAAKPQGSFGKRGQLGIGSFFSWRNQVGQVVLPTINVP
jgi:hypothetical protein